LPKENSAECIEKSQDDEVLVVNGAEYVRRFAYDAWANQEVLRAIQSSGPDERSLALLAHILSAERLWLERLQQVPQSSPVWPSATLEDCASQIEDMGRRWREYLGQISQADPARTIAYKNSKGEPWTSTVGDVLTHVILHSAYHRGQIASHMRASGKTPAYTDFIHAVRQGFVK
jgi:uncharacterized damage-inducible protein DinB